MVRELGFLTKSFDSAAPTPGFCQDRFRVSAKFDEKHVKRGGGGGGGGGDAWNVLFCRNYIFVKRIFFYGALTSLQTS